MVDAPVESEKPEVPAETVAAAVPEPVEHLMAAEAPVSAPAPALTPTQIMDAANADYLAKLTAAAAPDPKAKELRDAARELWKQADAIDGPERIAARQAAQQFQQFAHRAQHGRRPATAPVAK